MININVNTETGTAKPQQTATIKAGGGVPVTVTFDTNPGNIACIELAFSAQSSTPSVLAYLADFEKQSATVYTGVLDANDMRLVEHLAGKQAQTLDCELAITVAGAARQLFPNFPVTVQPPVMAGPASSEGGPVYLTEAMRASQAEAEAGTDNATWMTPLRTAQAIAELAPDPDGSGIEEAPVDSKQYARKGGAWTEVVAAGAAPDLTSDTITAESPATSVDGTVRESVVLLSVAAGSFTHDIGIEGESPDAGNSVRVFVDIAAGTQTVTVSAGASELFSFTNTDTASAGLLEFVFDGSAWVAAAPNIIFSTSAGSPPAITSSLTASGTVGSEFSYQITASNTPTSFGASNLPSGLSVNTSTGEISGTPSAAAETQITISATNESGTGTDVLVLTVAAASSNALTDALAYWTLDADTWVDSSGNNKTLTDSATTSVGTGKLGAGCASFGGDSALTVADATLEDVFSVSAWVKGTGSGIIMQAGRRDDSPTANGDYRLIVIGDLIVWQIYNGADINITGVFANNGTWQHLVGTYDGTTAKLYVNGSLVNSSAVTFTAAQASSFAIGANFTGGHLSGFATAATDEVGRWGFDLSLSQVEALYNTGTGFNPFAA